MWIPNAAATSWAFDSCMNVRCAPVSIMVRTATPPKWKVMTSLFFKDYILDLSLTHTQRETISLSTIHISRLLATTLQLDPDEK